MERLTGPALRLAGRIFARPFPCAHVHCVTDAQEALIDLTRGGKASEAFYAAARQATEEDEGFMTDAGRYVTREEAARIGDASGQVPNGITRFERNRRRMSELHAYDVIPERTV